MTILIFAILGALIFRWRGMDYNLHPLPQMLFALPYAIFCGWWAIIVYPITVIAVILGHGQYFLPPSDKKLDNCQRYDFLLVPFFGEDPRLTGAPITNLLYWRCFCGMAVSGLLVTIPSGIALHSPIIALSGALKAISYAVDNGNTKIAELLTGFFLYGALAIGIFYL